ncbi:FN3 associated domain-containing protein [Oceanirhabdus sp. W0125-5]|uniref:FN3 associated domain-containing protein n=1 Tax=Oceanirhabdus sp. W0125-5 TaxID=2999116 RepID=UPI0022F31FBE|nr:chitobiase/beta-hexosaminidase C-terminal domain-containing protein [Oceanirhabdus sp. W0125-5]WBW96485.1 chitobiase/beta-hexosaminidase C-terminal domain-containing protein [Oceanirhabdus sp. W0125-5]
MNKFYNENKKRIVSLCISMTMIFSILFGGYSPIVVKADDGNLFTNGGVENWTAGKPDGWDTAENVSESTEKVHGGSKSIKHTAGTKKLIKIFNDIEPGQEYTIRYWYYDNDDNAKTRPWMTWKDESNGYVKDHDAELHSMIPGKRDSYSINEDRWIQWEVRLTAPESASKFYFEVRVYNDGAKGGSVYYDDFFFGPVGGIAPETQVKDVKADKPSGKVIAGTEITLSTATEGADIYYQIGTEALTTTSSAIKYTVPITIDEDKEIHTVAVKAGLDMSKESIFNYEVLTEDDFDKIYDIQGKGHESTYKMQNVRIKGIVTAVSNDRDYKGIFVQEEVGDGDIATSDGIYVRGNLSSSYKVGDLVVVEGEVKEEKHTAFDGEELTVTEIYHKSGFVIESGKQLPEPIIIGKNGRNVITDNIDNDNMTSFDPEEDAIDFYESLEGMLVKVENPRIVAPEERYGTFHILADDGEASVDKFSAKGGIIPTKDNVNPEILHVDDVVVPVANSSKEFIDERFNNTKVGDKFDGDIVGVMDYNFASYKIYNTHTLPNLTDGGNNRETTSIVFDEDKLTVAVYNIENFSADATETSDEKVERIANSMVNDLGAPDIITLVEVQDNNGEPNKGDSADTIVDATESYKRLVNAIKAINGHEYLFTDIDPVYGQDGGAPGANIRVGFIYRPDRVDFNENKGGSTERAEMNGEHLAKNPSRVNPNSSYFESTRKSLVGEFIFRGESVFVIGNHLSSKRGDASDFGKVQPPVKGSEPNRHKQAQVVNEFIKEILEAKPDANIVVLGDMNDYEYSETLSILKGDELVNMIETLPKQERYTYVYGGNSQVLDNMLVSKNIVDKTVVDVVHLNAEFTEHSGRASDHDPVMIQISGIGTENSVKSVNFNVLDSLVKVGTVIELTTQEEAGTIYYTLDGSNPIDNGIEYTKAISLNETGNKTIKAVVKKGDNFSIEKSRQYKVDYAVTTVDVNPSEVKKGTKVKVTIDETDVEIYYSTGFDSKPSEGELFPVEGIEINEETVLKVVLKKGDEFSKLVHEYSYTVEPEAQLITIEEAKSKVNGEKVKISGIVTATIGRDPFIQDDTAGIYIYGKEDSNFVVGNKVEITGVRAEYKGLLQLSNVEEVKLISEGNKLPEGKVVTVSQINESVEGALVTIKDLEIVSVNGSGVKDYSIIAKDSTGTVELRADRYLKVEIDSSVYKAGMKINVTAPVGQRDDYRLMIRSAEDIKPQVEIMYPVKSSKEAGDVVLGTTVELSTETEGTEIYFTIDGSDPVANGKLYSEAIVLDTVGEVTIKSVAKKGEKNSEVTEFVYNVVENIELITIAQARETANDKKVKIKGIVTGLIGGNPFIQDTTAGIYIFGKDEDNFVVGNEVEITGKTAEFYGLKQLKSIEKVTVISTGNDILEAKVLTIAEINESVEGSLVTLKDVEITSIGTNKGSGYSIGVKDASGSIELRVDKYLNPTINGDNYEVGMKVDVIGNIGYSFGKYQIMLRSSSDIKILGEENKGIIKEIVIKTKGYTINQEGKITLEDKSEFNLGSTVVINADITANIDTKATVIMKVVGDNGFVYSLNFINNVELKNGESKSISAGATLFNAPAGNYKAEVLVWDSLEGMKPFTKVGEYNFKIKR